MLRKGLTPIKASTLCTWMLYFVFNYLLHSFPRTQFMLLPAVQVLMLGCGDCFNRFGQTVYLCCVIRKQSRRRLFDVPMQ